MVNGARANAIISIEVNNNNYYQADHFEVTLSLSGQPQATNWAWWVAQKDLVVECFIGFPTDPNHFTEKELDSLILGSVDSMEIDPVKNEIMLSGRDYTAKFIDARTTQKYVNQTSSQIATTLATQNGLTAQVTTTKSRAGQYYAAENSKLAKAMPQWDLLTFLANQEGFDVYVKGTTLYFNPKATAGDSYALQWNAKPTFNGMAINFTRDLSKAHDVYVLVRYTDIKNKKGLTVSDPQGKPGKAQQFIYNYKPATREQALQFAQKQRAAISQHEIKLSASLPGDNILNARTPIQVTGTGTAFDQTYYAESVERRLSKGGYTMNIRAKNHATDSQVGI